MRDIYLDERQTARFKGNSLVKYLLDAGGLSLNALALLPGIPREDWAELAQLIGYSVSGFGSLSYVLADEAQEAEERAARLLGEPEADESGRYTNHFRYELRCRHCGKSMSYQGLEDDGTDEQRARYEQLVLEQHPYYATAGHCEHCGNTTVQDVTVIRHRARGKRRY